MIQDESNSQVSELSWVWVVTVLIYAETTSALLFVFSSWKCEVFLLGLIVERMCN